MIPMACAYPVIFLSMLLVLPTIQGRDEVVYRVTNDALDTTGGLLFHESITDEEAKDLMRSSADFLWNWVFCQEHSSDRKQVKEMKLIIAKSDQWRLFAHGLGNGGYEVHISEKHIDDVCADEEKAEEKAESLSLKTIVKVEVRWMLTFGIAQHLQWRHDGDEPIALWYGIAAYAVTAAGYEPSIWAKDGEGNAWDDKYDVTGRFFCFINKTIPHFVADLNKKMKNSYSSSYFKDVTGKTIGEWWSMYKRHYHKG